MTYTVLLLKCGCMNSITYFKRWMQVFNKIDEKTVLSYTHI